jgi:hypothetical protein
VGPRTGLVDQEERCDVALHDLGIGLGVAATLDWRSGGNSSGSTRLRDAAATLGSKSLVLGGECTALRPPHAECV